MKHRARLFAAAALSALFLTACGGQTAKTTTQQGGTAVQGSADMNCGGVKPVWVNTRTHVYHEPSDPYYGKTKQGKYLCPNQAAAEGDRASRQSGANSNATDTNATTTTTAKRHHRRKPATSQ